MDFYVGDYYDLYLLICSESSLLEYASYCGRAKFASVVHIHRVAGLLVHDSYSLLFFAFIYFFIIRLRLNRLAFVCDAFVVCLPFDIMDLFLDICDFANMFAQLISFV